jgi:hypothetical protein
MGAINARKVAFICDVAAAFAKSIFFCQICPIRFHALAFKVVNNSLPQFIYGDVRIMDRAAGYAGARQFPGQESFSQTSIGLIRKNIYALIV